MAQLRMFADQAPPKAAPTADLDRVRRKLAAFLTEASEAGGDGLPLQRRRLMQTVVPQMIRWLPPDRADEEGFWGRVGRLSFAAGGSSRRGFARHSPSKKSGKIYSAARCQAGTACSKNVQ
jgi:hypothetical protein